MIVAGIGLVIGAWLPWVSGTWASNAPDFASDGMTFVIRGLDTGRLYMGGWLTLVVGVAVCVVAVSDSLARGWPLTLVGGTAGLVTALYRFSTASDELGRVGQYRVGAYEDPGVGLWVTFLSSAVIIGVSLWIAAGSRRGRLDPVITRSG